MARSLFSPSWYRVADLRVRLRPHVTLERHVLRGRRWHIAQDRQTGRYYRLSPAAHLMVCLMDGKRALRQIWETAARRFGSAQPTQDETIQLVAQLYRADLLIGSVAPDVIELFRRGESQEQQQMMRRLRNPLVIRLPLFDPDRFLTRTAWLLRPLFSRTGFAVWLVLIAVGIVLAALHGSELRADLADRMLSANTIVLLLLAYPIVKAVHELGHAYAAKLCGGEVHEIGIMLLALFPVPYVDASAASGFPDKWHRAVVGAAGIMVELVLAVGALVVWITVEPGLVRALAFTVMLIGGVSTVLFNGNPLLRFDGYYVLSDLIEIPNLGTRASGYVFYLLRRYGFGTDEQENFADTRGERAWLLVYALASTAYRTLITLGLALFFATKFFFIGVAFALWSVGSLLIWPVVKGLSYLLRAPRLRTVRLRAAFVAALLVIVPASMLLGIPIPYASTVQGVVEAPEQAVVRAASDGFVRRIVATSGSEVEVGDTLLTLEDPETEALVTVLDARRKQFQLRLAAVELTDLVQANLLREQVRRIDASHALAVRKLADMTVRSTNAGRFVLPEALNLPGRLVHRGDLLGYVVSSHDLTARVVVAQADIDLVRQRTRQVELRYAYDVANAVSARVEREVPAAQKQLPSAALGLHGGGDIVADPADATGRSALERAFLVDVVPDVAPQLADIGGRVFVRFEYAPEPLAGRMLRHLRQLFLKYLDV
jgi:putative peptide zinc metalloprotease protein